MAEPVPMWRPKTFTSADAMMDEVRKLVANNPKDIKEIASRTGVTSQTVRNIVKGKTKWPRQTTLFPLLSALGYRVSLTRK